jgi:ubiquinone/menaquinone biosynthesis C-methylase UbiE
MPSVPGAASWFSPPRCLYCGHGELLPWIDGVADRLKFVRGRWSFVRCAHCDSGHLTPMPAPEHIAQLYPAVYSFRSDYAPESRFKLLFARLEEVLFYRAMRRAEVATIGRRTGVSSGTVLDVGCGTGDRLRRFAESGFQVHGLEVQRALAEDVRHRFGFAVDVGSLDSIPYPNDAFDLVTMYWVLEHLLDVRAALTTIYRILRPGGWVVAEVPLSDSFQSALLGRRWSQFGDAPRHIAIPSRRGLTKLVAKCGFVDVSIRPSGIMNCAAGFALSLIPRAATMYAYTSRALTAHVARVAGGLITLLYAPVAGIENYVLGRPAFGLLLARKPL